MTRSRFRGGRLRRLLASVRRSPHPELVRLTAEDWRYLTSLYDDSVPLPDGAEQELSEQNPRLGTLRTSYARLDVPALAPSRWSREAVGSFLDLRYFRGETLITWHYRELPRITALKYFIFMRYVTERDSLGLLGRLEEDGAFGCWTYSYPGYGRFSRDLLQSVNEISFLERELKLSAWQRLRVVDVGAGYGRLAHRMAGAYPTLADYCCLDAVPESTFLSEYYLRYRGCTPPGRVVSLDRIEADLRPGDFDLAVNVHSFSECTHAAIAWWMDLLRRLEVSRLLIVPNESTGLLSLERDGRRRDFRPLLEEAGYERIRCEPVLTDPAVRALFGVEDYFHLFELRA
jgi:SAM-dependent methyltransferase